MEEGTEPFEYLSAKAVLEIAKNAPGDSVILLGQTGGGKSSLANAILNLDQNIPNTLQRTFPEGEDLTSVTEDVQVAVGKWFGDPNKEDVTVIDTPGLLDSENRSSEFLAGLLDLLENLPPQRLRLIIITLPLTEARAKSTYTDMLDIIDGLFRTPDLKPIWEHVCFVHTCSNLLADQPERLSKKRIGWNEFLINRGVENPFIAEFKYGDPFSLEPIRQKFISLAAYTPKATAEMASFIQNNPSASVADKVEQITEWKDLQEKWAKELEDADKKAQQTINQLRKLERLNKKQLESLKKAELKHKKLEKKVRDIRLMRQIVFGHHRHHKTRSRHHHHHHHHHSKIAKKKKKKKEKTISGIQISKRK